jgi:hypothetical protein
LCYAIPVDINESEVAERFPDIKEALNHLDLIVFLPITKENFIDYPEENPTYRKAADKNFKKLYRDEICNIFPKYGHPKIIEISGDRASRIKKLESYLTYHDIRDSSEYISSLKIKSLFISFKLKNICSSYRK